MHLCASCSSGAWRGRMGAATQRKPGACNVLAGMCMRLGMRLFCAVHQNTRMRMFCVCVCVCMWLDGWVQCSAHASVCQTQNALSMHAFVCLLLIFRRYGHRGRSLARRECAYVIQCVQMLAPMHVSESTLCARAWACACAPTLRIQAPLCAVLNNFCFV
jgi:hypothetical protein